MSVAQTGTAVEELKDLRLLGSRNARPGIGHADDYLFCLDRPIFNTGRQHNLATGRRIFAGVVEQIADNLANAFPIALDPWQSGGTGAMERQTAVRSKRFKLLILGL